VLSPEVFGLICLPPANVTTATVAASFCERSSSSLLGPEASGDLPRSVPVRPEKGKLWGAAAVTLVLNKYRIYFNYQKTHLGESGMLKSYLELWFATVLKKPSTPLTFVVTVAGKCDKHFGT
jgi:hypothetical protein